MTVIAAKLYHDGQPVRDVALDERIQCGDGRHDFVWIGLAEPDQAEMDRLAATWGLHPLAVEDAMKPGQLPKLDIYGDQLFIITRTARLEGEKIVYGQTAIFIGRGHIITVRLGSTRAHSELRRELEAAPGLMRQGTDYVLHGILDFVVDGYLPLVVSIEEEVLDMERRTIDNFLERDEINRIFAIRRELVRLQRVLAPMEEVARKLAHLDLPGIDPEARPYFNDVLDHVRRVRVNVDGLREVISSVFEVSSLLEQKRTGDITRQLAAWAAILAVPTAIAGIYGMNFEHMPELKSPYGYPAVLGVIGLVCLWLYWRFKRARWL